jgi:hypothetical protein
MIVPILPFSSASFAFKFHEFKILAETGLISATLLGKQAFGARAHVAFPALVEPLSVFLETFPTDSLHGILALIDPLPTFVVVNAPVHFFFARRQTEFSVRRWRYVRCSVECHVPLDHAMRGRRWSTRPIPILDVRPFRFNPTLTQIPTCIFSGGAGVECSKTPRWRRRLWATFCIALGCTLIFLCGIKTEIWEIAFQIVICTCAHIIATNSLTVIIDAAFPSLMAQLVIAHFRITSLPTHLIKITIILPSLPVATLKTTCTILLN